MIKTRMIIGTILILLLAAYITRAILRRANGKRLFKRILLYGYIAMALLSMAYFALCVRYAGMGLSLVFLWPAISAFCLVRAAMLFKEIQSGTPLPIPKTFRIFYRIALVAFLSVFILIEAKIVGAMHATPRDNLTYIIVLGAAVRGGKPSNPLKARIERAAEYMKENPDTVLIATGGLGEGDDITEASCIKKELVTTYGIEAERILLEDASRNTKENLKYSLEMIGDESVSVGIVSNGFHEYRAILIAKQVGFTDVHPIPAVTLLPVGIHYTVREFFGVLDTLIRR